MYKHLCSRQLVFFYKGINSIGYFDVNEQNKQDFIKEIEAKGKRAVSWGGGLQACAYMYRNGTERSLAVIHRPAVESENMNFRTDVSKILDDHRLYSKPFFTRNGNVAVLLRNNGAINELEMIDNRGSEIILTTLVIKHGQKKIPSTYFASMPRLLHAIAQSDIQKKSEGLLLSLFGNFGKTKKLCSLDGVKFKHKPLSDTIKEMIIQANFPPRHSKKDLFYTLEYGSKYAFEFDSYQNILLYYAGGDSASAMGYINKLLMVHVKNTQLHTKTQLMHKDVMLPINWPDSWFKSIMKQCSWDNQDKLREFIEQVTVRFFIGKNITVVELPKIVQDDKVKKLLYIAYPVPRGMTTQRYINPITISKGSYCSNVAIYWNQSHSSMYYGQIAYLLKNKEKRTKSIVHTMIPSKRTQQIITKTIVLGPGAVNDLWFDQKNPSGHHEPTLHVRAKPTNNWEYFISPIRYYNEVEQQSGANPGCTPYTIKYQSNILAGLRFFLAKGIEYLKTSVYKIWQFISYVL